jgi:uncharacterized protein (TIGR02147 family)
MGVSIVYQAKAAANSVVMSEGVKKPDVFSYSDYKVFLKDTLQFLKERDSGFSLRKFSKQVGLSSGYLPIILNTPQHVAQKTLEKIIPFLELTPAQNSYLRVLREMASPLTAEQRENLLKKLQTFENFKNSAEIEMVGYLEHWYHIAIRELAQRDDFFLDAEWIRKHLQFPITASDAEKSITFLTENGFLTALPNKRARVESKELNCQGRIYSLALAKSHKQFLKLGSDAIDTVERSQRSVLGHIMALDTEGIAEARKILSEALEKIARIEVKDKNSQILNFSLVAYPLTKKSGDEK